VLVTRKSTGPRFARDPALSSPHNYRSAEPYADLISIFLG
jgi:hypothetical protein